MKLFNKLPGSQCSPPGLERVILRRLPMAFTCGLALILSPSFLLRLSDWDLHPLRLATVLAKTDIYVASGLLCFLNIAVAIAIGAVIVWLMKGPAYVADEYPLPDFNQPGDEPPVYGSPESSDSKS